MIDWGCQFIGGEGEEGKEKKKREGKGEEAAGEGEVVSGGVEGGGEESKEEEKGLFFCFGPSLFIIYFLTQAMWGWKELNWFEKIIL